LYHAKGQPKFIDGKVIMNAGAQMRNIRDAMRTINGFPQLKELPQVIGESDPEGCAACGMRTNPENAYRNGTMYSSYTAATFARKYLLADSMKANLAGAVSWSFEFEDQPWFEGFRDLATNGVDKPVLNVFRMFGLMKGNRVQVSGNRMYSLQKFTDSSVRGLSDIGGLATKEEHSASILIWNYHDEDISTGSEEVSIRLTGLPAGKINLTEYRVDKEYSNSYERWKEMGSPQQPTAKQVKQLEKAGQLYRNKKSKKIEVNESAIIKVELPRQAVVLLQFTW
jgi:xylan 1,4-beta-xylosidase